MSPRIPRKEPFGGLTVCQRDLLLHTCQLLKDYSDVIGEPPTDPRWSTLAGTLNGYIYRYVTFEDGAQCPRDARGLPTGRRAQEFAPIVDISLHALTIVLLSRPEWPGQPRCADAHLRGAFTIVERHLSENAWKRRPCRTALDRILPELAGRLLGAIGELMKKGNNCTLPDLPDDVVWDLLARVCSPGVNWSTSASREFNIVPESEAKRMVARYVSNASNDPDLTNAKFVPGALQELVKAGWIVEVPGWDNRPWYPVDQFTNLSIGLAAQRVHTATGGLFLGWRRYLLLTHLSGSWAGTELAKEAEDSLQAHYCTVGSWMSTDPDALEHLAKDAPKVPLGSALGHSPLYRVAKREREGHKNDPLHFSTCANTVKDRPFCGRFDLPKGGVNGTSYWGLSLETCWAEALSGNRLVMLEDVVCRDAWVMTDLTTVAGYKLVNLLRAAKFNSLLTAPRDQTQTFARLVEADDAKGIMYASAHNLTGPANIAFFGAHGDSLAQAAGGADELEALTDDTDGLWQCLDQQTDLILRLHWFPPDPAHPRR